MTADTEPKKKKSRIVLIIAAVLVFLCVVCGIFGAITNSTPAGKATATARALERTAEASKPTATPRSVDATQPTDESKSTSTPRPANTPKPTNTPRPTNTPKPTNTPRPTNTPLPPTATPDPNLVRPGTYLVGTDIQPGIYRGQAGYDLFKSCYWARLKDLSGDLGATIANDNSIGHFYVEIAKTDYAFSTKCELVFLPSLPEPPNEFPQTIMPGTYLVGRDIQPGTYKGKAGTEILESCYWARLRDVLGGLNSVIANDNATGQYYVKVQPRDFAFSTKCELERTGD